MSHVVKKVESQEIFCDVCGEGVYPWNVCRNCGGDFCEKHSVRYPGSLYFSTGDDGYFCQACLKKLAAAPTPLFSVYNTLKSLRSEIGAFEASVKERSSTAEAQLKTLLA